MVSQSSSPPTASSFRNFTGRANEDATAPELARRGLSRRSIIGCAANGGMLGMRCQLLPFCGDGLRGDENRTAMSSSDDSVTRWGAQLRRATRGSPRVDFFSASGHAQLRGTRGAAGRELADLGLRTVSFSHRSRAYADVPQLPELQVQPASPRLSFALWR